MVDLAAFARPPGAASEGIAIPPRVAVEAMRNARRSMGEISSAQGKMSNEIPTTKRRAGGTSLRVRGVLMRTRKLVPPKQRQIGIP